MNWYESFFTELAVEFWRAAVTPEATRAEADWLERNLDVKPGAKLLDLPCGVGRHVFELQARGYDVTGIDLSAHAVKAKGLTRGDMRDPIGTGPYDGAYCFGNSFGYLSTEDTQRFLENVRAALKPGARWALDTGLIAESVLPHAPVQRALTAGGVTYDVSSRYDEQAHRIVQQVTLTRGSERQESQLSYAIYSLAELALLLEGAALRVRECQGNLEGKAFAPGDRRLLLIAEAA